ncbi:hypothetical protein BDY17DRAFT_78666 [Neohortaea acidophila]|uniref:F-box domain-containing protein n=1 Tax=Neohortaea acidophila TaxID=245834 RepID=A0A6A6Q4T2_9PEZI|nr:uncharacterized protein BDY17DRAFT_78666 [Neohortaea acidophila]KAF2486417.1 hypothetical protein BDY17DRAFT_78666 [Neohortaea acidophila]
MAAETANGSMASISVQPLSPPDESPQSPSRLIPPPFEEQPRRKLKGRARLLAGLQRISSSQSLSRAGHANARGYNGSGKGSISCISLSSAPSLLSPPYTPTLSDEHSYFHTAPTSGTSTPRIALTSRDERARVIHLISAEAKNTATLPVDLRPTPKSPLEAGIAEVDEDYFSRPISKPAQPLRDFNFWRDLPSELRMGILSYLDPREVIRCSSVSKSWHEMCFDGQLWAVLDTASFYQHIPADALVSLITSAGPFLRDLNLRGCVQLRERWHARGLSDACRNLENFCLEGCRIDRTSIHNFLYNNSRLVHINLCGLAGTTNSAMKIIAANCPRLEFLSVSWCNNVDTTGLKRVIAGCPNLTDLRASEIRGWDDVDFAHQIFLRNSLERLVLMNCESLTDEALAVLMEGKDSEVDYLTGRPIVPPRKLKHLDLTRCRGITDKGLRTLVGNVPELEGLQLSKCHGVVDTMLTELFPTTPNLTHLDLEELDELTNAMLHSLAGAACAKGLQHLSISYCENLGDTGMLPLLQSCTNLRSLEMDNTRISDLVLTEAAAMVRRRAPRTLVQEKQGLFLPKTGLRLIAYDCQNVTWTGVREVLSRNAEFSVTTHAVELPPLDKSTTESSAASSVETLPSPVTPPPRLHIVRSTSYPTEVVNLKCFYNYQPTVEEHTKRVMRGDFLSARRLERKWAEFMMAQEEAGAGGAGSRRRRRRVREAQMMHADEEDGAGTPGSGVGGGRRRRARSGGCALM